MAMFRTLVAVVFGAERLAFAAESKSKMIVHNLGKEDLGIYFLGAVEGMLDGSESFCSSISPGEATGRYVHLNDSFAIRSGDMRWRSRVTLFAHEDKMQPFKLSFHNIMVEDDPEPIELQHHDEGFIWIEPHHQITHATIGGHEFILKDKNHNSRFSIEVHQLDKDEL